MSKQTSKDTHKGFASKAQIAKFQELHKAGKIGTQDIARWALATKDIKNLPDRVEKHEEPKKKS